jgi:uncharacterized protein YueI
LRKEQINPEKQKKYINKEKRRAFIYLEKKNTNQDETLKKNGEGRKRKH